MQQLCKIHRYDALATHARVLKVWCHALYLSDK